MDDQAKEVNPPEGAEQEIGAKPREEPNAEFTTRGALGCAVFVLLLLGGTWWIAAPDNSPEAQRQREEIAARTIVTVICEAEMGRRLSAPGSANYPSGQAANVQSLGGNLYRLQSYVDAENASGGDVRSNFVCLVEGAGEQASSYKVMQFTVLE